MQEEEDVRPPAARSAGEEDQPRTPEHTLTAPAARPEDEGAPRQSRDYTNTEAHFAGARQGGDGAAILARPRSCANLSDVSAPAASACRRALVGEIVPAAADGLSAVLGDLAELVLDDLITDHEALGGRDHA